MNLRPFPQAHTRLEFAGEITTFLMVLNGYGALAATGEMGTVHAAIVFIGAIFAVFWNEKARPAGRLFWNGLVIVSLIFGLAEWFFLEGGFVKAVVHFLAYVQLVRLISRTGDRDTLWLQLLSFFQLTAAAILTLNLSFLFFYLTYMLVGTWAMMVFTIKRETARAGVESGRAAVGSGFFASGGAVSVAIFLVAMIVFFMVPRIGTGFFAWARKSGQKLTGFSDSVSLGDLGRIKEDRSTAMRIKIVGDTAPRDVLYWRGSAMDSFDGKTWSNKDAGSRRLYAETVGEFVLERKPRGEVIEQEIFLEPMDANIIFSASEPISFRFKQPDSLRQDFVSRMSYVLLHDDGFISLPAVEFIQDRIRYFADSDLYTPPVEALAASSDRIPTDILYRYTRLPAIAPEVERLANKITENARNNYEKAEAVKKYLLDNYSYTLDLSENTPDDPLPYFLFKAKKGHCEYFATAMAVLLRAIKVPTRMVNGFQRGEWNGDDQYYRVRQSDAHSWVEVYFTGIGWVLYDPTPADSITYDESHGWWGRIDDFLDPWRYRWSRYFVDYNFDMQSKTATVLRNRGSAVGARFYGSILGTIKNILKSVPKTVLFIIAVIALAAWAIVALSRRLSGKRLAAAKIEMPDLEIRRIYLKALRKLEARGLGRLSSQTPIEHAASIQRLNAKAAAPLRTLAGYFNVAVYGGRSMSRDEATTARKLLKEIADSFK